MTTVLIIFTIALLSSLLLTPLVKVLGIKAGALDKPDERKVHSQPIPRIGGLAIFISVLAALALGRLLGTNVSNLIVFDRQMLLLLAGGGVCFGIGIIDDFRGVRPSLKFLFQIIGSTLAFWGGIKFSQFQILGVLVSFGPLDYFMTVFWFVLFINAVNLIDGLDGLAIGISVFASLVMVVLSVLREDFLTALLFAALGGSVLGFLRYNFNPASIFLGDGGSYFLGYAIAGLSIMGSVKSQVSVVMLIPLLALGVPIFDTILAPLRRFIRGRKMFAPDNGHVHHRSAMDNFTLKRIESLRRSIPPPLTEAHHPFAFKAV